MGRFVPMGILSDKTTDVGRGIFAFQPGIQGKETVEFGYKSFGTSVQGDQPFDIVLHQPGILPGVTFGVFIVPVVGIERGEGCFPFSGRRFAPHKTGTGVEKIGVIAGGV